MAKVVKVKGSFKPRVETINIPKSYLRKIVTDIYQELEDLTAAKDDLEEKVEVMDEAINIVKSRYKTLEGIFYGSRPWEDDFLEKAPKEEDEGMFEIEEIPQVAEQQAATPQATPQGGAWSLGNMQAQAVNTYANLYYGGGGGYAGPAINVTQAQFTAATGVPAPIPGATVVIDDQQFNIVP